MPETPIAARENIYDESAALKCFDCDWTYEPSKRMTKSGIGGRLFRQLRNHTRATGHCVYMGIHSQYIEQTSLSSKREQLILEFLETREGFVPTSDIRTHTGLELATLRRTLERLRESNEVVRKENPSSRMRGYVWCAWGNANCDSCGEWVHSGECPAQSPTPDEPV